MSVLLRVAGYRFFLPVGVTNMLMSVKKQRLVVIGNGMAGIRVVEELIKLAPDLYEITVFGAEPHPNYNRIMLSPVLAGEQQFEEIGILPERVITLPSLASATVAARTWSRCITAAD